MAETILAGTDTDTDTGTVAEEAPVQAEAREEGKGKGRTRGGRGRKNARGEAPFVAVTPDEAAQAAQADEPAVDDAAESWPAPAALEEVVAVVEPAVLEAVPEEAAPAKKERRRAARKPAAKKAAPDSTPADAASEPVQAEPAPAEVPVAEVTAPAAALAFDDEAEAEDEHLPGDVNGNVAGGGSAAVRPKTGRGASNGPARKPAARSRRPAKPKASPGNS